MYTCYINSSDQIYLFVDITIFLIIDVIRKFCFLIFNLAFSMLLIVLRFTFAPIIRTVSGLFKSSIILAKLFSLRICYSISIVHSSITNVRIVLNPLTGSEMYQK